MAVAEIMYDCATPYLIESKSLKLYFNSFNNTQFKDIDKVRQTVEQDLSVDNFAALLDKMHDERDGLYEQVASFSLSSDNGDIEGHATSIINAMKK